MAFTDAPEVDDNSKASEESVNAVRAFFTRRNGFIFREETPDYGVDVDVELVVKEKDASSWKFPIQIKSKKSLTIIKESDEELISFPFMVSRLGYLSKRAPAYGIIVVFDEEQQQCYYDYVDAVIARLDKHQQRVGWRTQKSVSILLPLQLIDSGSLVSIHQTMVTRHENHEKLIAKHGRKYDIPYLQVSRQAPIETDLTDPAQAVTFLVKYGTFLFNEQEFTKILTLFGIISATTILNTPELLFLAAITYCRTGNAVDAEYYLRKIEKKKASLTTEQRGIIQFSELRLDFLKGEIDYDSFLLQISALEDNIEGVENRLLVKINKLFFELNKTAASGDFEIATKNRIDALTDEITKAYLPENQKHLMLVYHADNINSFALESFLHFNSSFQLGQSLKIDMPMKTRIAFAQFSTGMLSQAIKLGIDAYRFADENNSFLLKASAAHNLGKFFFQARYYFLMQQVEENLSTKDEMITEYRRFYAFSVTAYNHFMKLQMQQNAHEAVCNAYELQSLCLKLLGFQLGKKTGSELMLMIRQIEDINDLQPFNSASDFITEVVERRKSTAPTRLANITDESIDLLAKDALKLLQLPIERLPNMISEIKAIRSFELHCNNPDIELLTNNNHMASNETKYLLPSTFVLHNKRTGKQTQPYNDIDRLLENFKHLLN
jgi:hypothetical protein